MSSTLANLELPSVVTVGDFRFETELLKPAEEIQTAVATQADELAAHYAALGDVHVLTVLNGAMHYASDLRRAMQSAEPSLPMTSDQMRVSSYENTSSTNTVNVHQLPAIKMEGRHVLLADDIFDTGGTLKWILNYLDAQKPASVEVAVAVNKLVPGRPENLLGPIALHQAFDLPDKFVVGYGLDFNERFRDLSSIYVLKPVDATD